MTANESHLAIENGVLKGYKSEIENLVVTDGMTEIGEYAFENCTFYLVSVLVNSFKGSVFRKQFDRSFLTYAFNARNIVSRVAH